MLSNCAVGEDSWRVSWTTRRSNQSVLEKINPEYSLKGLILKLKHQYFGHLMLRADSLERPWCWERLKEKGTTEDEVVGWHRRLNGREWIWGDSRRQWRTEETVMLQSLGLQSQTPLSNWATAATPGKVSIWKTLAWNSFPWRGSSKGYWTRVQESA